MEKHDGEEQGEDSLGDCRAGSERVRLEGSGRCVKTIFFFHAGYDDVNVYPQINCFHVQYILKTTTYSKPSQLLSSPFARTSTYLQLIVLATIVIHLLQA